MGNVDNEIVYENAKHEPVNTFERSLHAGDISAQRAISKKGALSSILQDRNSQDLLFGSAEAAPFQAKLTSLLPFCTRLRTFLPALRLNTHVHAHVRVRRVFQVSSSLRALF